MPDTLEQPSPAWQQRMKARVVEAEAEAEQARTAWVTMGTPEAATAFARAALRAAVCHGLARDLEDVAAGKTTDRSSVLRRACRRGLAGASHP